MSSWNLTRENEGYQLVFWGGIFLGTIIDAVDGLPLHTCDDKVLGYLEGFVDGDVVENCLYLCCCTGCVHM